MIKNRKIQTYLSLLATGLILFSIAYYFDHQKQPHVADENKLSNDPSILATLKIADKINHNSLPAKNSEPIADGTPLFQSKINSISANEKLFPKITDDNSGKKSTGSFLVFGSDTYFLDQNTKQIVKLSKAGKAQVIAQSQYLISGMTIKEDGTLVYIENRKNGELAIFEIDQNGAKKTAKVTLDEKFNHYGSTSEILSLDNTLFIELGSEYFRVGKSKLTPVPGKPSLSLEQYYKVAKDLSSISIVDRSGKNIGNITLEKKYLSIKNIHPTINQNLIIEYDHLQVSKMPDGSEISSRQLILEKYNANGDKISQVFLDRPNDFEIDLDVYVNKNGEVFQQTWNEASASFEFVKVKI